MTLCVAVTTAEGLVLGADSMTVVKTESQTKQYTNANKVFEIPNLPIVVMTYGLGAVGRRSIGSLLQEWSEQRIPYEKADYAVQCVAQDLSDFVFDRHKQYLAQLRAQAEQRQERVLGGGSATGDEAEPFEPREYLTGLVVGGYQPNSRFPWLYTREEPARPGIPEGLTLTRPHQGIAGRDGPEPGLDYWGDTIALDRLYHGCDAQLVTALRDVTNDQDALHDTAMGQSWQVVFEGMPVQDAADLVQFMLEVGCGFERFKEGVPQIGGALDIAVVTQSRTHWSARKPMTSALAGFGRRATDSASPQKGAL